MKVLWIVNVTFPEALSLLGEVGASCKSTGGWLISSADALADSGEIELFVVSALQNMQQMTVLKGKFIEYILLPCEVDVLHSIRQKELWHKIEKDIKPDIVHIHGTENLLGLSYINACGNEKVVLSIQGVMGLIGNYFYKGMTFRDVIRSLTPYDVFRRQSIWHLRLSFCRRGKFEEDIYRKLKYVIGRTTVDKAHVWFVNSAIKYFHCDEILRPEFYNGQWKYENCEKHTIFMSQASYPVKGLHQVLKAVPTLLRIFPDFKLRIAGADFTNPISVRDKLKFGGYANYIRKQIKKYKLEKTITFTGPLDAEGMKNEYLKANAFLSASTIENSPNSLGEAQLLGVPCLASYVGGVPDMIPNERCGQMYRFEDTEAIVYKIAQIFEQSMDFDNTEMRSVALERHSVKRHVSDTINIYSQIIKDNSQC